MRLAFLLPVLLVGACATAPKEAATQPSASAAPAAVAAPATAPGAGSATTAPASGADKKFATIDASNIAEAQAAGYKVVNENGTTLLCRKAGVSGTRLKQTTTCLTAQEWRAKEEEGREAMTTGPIPAYTNGRP